MRLRGKNLEIDRPRRRKRVKAVWQMAEMRAGLITVALAALAVSGWWVWQTDLIEQTVQKSKWMAISVTSNLGFQLDEIFVEGRHLTGRSELLGALRLKRGAPIFGFDPDAAHARLKSLP